MSTSDEVTAVTPENIARFKLILADRSDGALEIEARNTASAVGIAAAELLFERRAKRAKDEAELALGRHERLLRAIETPHWSQTPSFWAGVIAALSGLVAAWYGYLAYQQALQSSAQGQQASSVSPSVSQKSASSSLPSASSPSSQSTLPKR